jgi:hypothetical protein
MDSVELPRPKVLAIIDPPKFQEWGYNVASAADDELVALQQRARAGIAGDGDSRRWGIYRNGV